MSRYAVIDGLRVKVGGPLYRFLKRNHLRLIGRMPKQRAMIVAWAYWGVKHEPRIHYSEAATRGEWLHKPPGALPMTTDCSGWATACYKWAGARDPNGLAYKQVGYTGTLLDYAAKHGHIENTPKASPGDLLVYGPGTGEHVVIVVKAGTDPLTVSHGRESGPELVRVSQDGRKPQRVCRYLP